MLKKLWHDPVWSKVIAGVILAVSATVATYFLHWWPAIGEFISQCFTFAMASSTTPNWLLFVLGLLALPMVILLGAIVREKIFPPQPSSPSWRSYTTDFFFGLRWRWTYGSRGEIYNAHTFCPNCDFQVFARDVSSYRVIDHIAFHCESCGRHLGEFQESFASLESKTERFIQQKIRNGSWLTQSGA
jgi:hypothetical protein